LLGAVGDGVAAGVTEIARDFYFPRDQDIDTAPEDDLGLDLDGDSHEVQERGVSDAGRVSHLAGDRCDGLLGEWRPARACPADGCA